MSDAEEKEENNRGTPTAIDEVVRLDQPIMATENNGRRSPKSSSPSRQFKLRRSVDSPDRYEAIAQDDISDAQLETSISSKNVPRVKMQRIDTQMSSNKADAIENGLAPEELALISASAMCDPLMSLEDEEEEMLDEEVLEEEEGEKVEEELEISIIEKEEEEEDDYRKEDNINVSSSSASNTIYEIITPSKMNREMRNLQQSTSDSKVLSDYLSVTDTPRARNRKAKEIQMSSSSNEHEASEGNVPKVIDTEIPLKDSGNDDSDSTIVMVDEVSKKRRKSVSHSRSRTAARSKSVSSRSRKSDFLAEEAERNLADEAADDDIIGETPYVAKLIENRAPNPPPKLGWDSYCFKCHADTAVLSLACKKCKCSYHRHCARLLSTPIPKNPDDFVCIDCIEIEKARLSSINKYNHSKIDPHMLKEMLLTILEKIRTYPDRDFFENDIQFRSTLKENNQPLIITQMSLKRIEERIISIYYKVSEAFLHDIKQLEHNWTIVDRNKLKSLKLILKFVNTEINEMEACVHCFSNSFVVSNWFTAPCKRPHLLIWAKLKGYPYWPAKVMSLDNTKENADVRFFGAHDRAWVPVSHCLIFSDKDPNKAGKSTTPTNNKSKSQKGIADAIKEKDEYIQNMKERYGFRFSSTREILDPDNLQAQLEGQLPGLKKDGNTNPNSNNGGGTSTSSTSNTSITNNNNDKGSSEIDKIQKEKLTLKIVKASDGTQTIEKTPKINEKDRHPLYRVLSKNDDTAENNDQTRVVKAIILKRNTDIDKETERGARSRNASLSETSESNISSVSATSLQKKSAKETAKRRKSVRKETRSVTPEPMKKKQKPDNDPSRLLTALSLQPKKPSAHDDIEKVIEKMHAPVVVPANRQIIPAGTNEIYKLNEVPKALSRTAQRSQSFTRAHEKNKSAGKSRRLSTHSNPSTLSHKSIATTPFKKVTLQKRVKSTSRASTPVSIPSSRNSPKRPSTNEFTSEIVIKDEPMSEDEEILQRGQVTIHDLAEIVGDNPSKRKTIVISTSDNSNDSFQNQVSRARKSFLKPLAGSAADTQAQMMVATSAAMVCIPQVFPTTPQDLQSPSSSSSAMRNPTNEIRRRHSSTNVQPQVLNGNDQIYNVSSPDASTVSQVSQPEAVTIHQRHLSTNSDSSGLPQLLPRPAGVFTCEGNVFQRESGDVAALFSQNAHRMTDYFKSLLVDTIGAISNGVSDAQNVILKLENEKLKQQIYNMKAEGQQKMEKLRKEHLNELNLLKANYEDKIKIIYNANKEDNVTLIKQIRQQCEIEKQRAIEATRRETKKMTWCSNCTKEARFYCCWNTSYCGPACQKNHWQQHMKYCTNRNSNHASDGNSKQQQQQQQQQLQQQQQQQQLQQQQHQIEVTAVSSAINVTNASATLANLAANSTIAANNSRQLLQQSSLPKQPTPPQMMQQTQQSHPATSAMSQLESTLLRANAVKPHMLVARGGPHIIRTVVPQYLIQQQKLSPVTLQTAGHVTTEQNTLAGNVIVRTLPPRNNSPQMTVITTSANINEFIASQQQQQQSQQPTIASVVATLPVNVTTAKILNPPVINSNGKIIN